jgi:nucleotide-binding universal stress UspA family protein
VDVIIRMGEPGLHLVALTGPGDILVIGRRPEGWRDLLAITSTRRYCARYAKAVLVIVPPAGAWDEAAAREHRAGRRS